MKRKILTFIVNDGKFLALEMTKHPEHAPKGGAGSLLQEKSEIQNLMKMRSLEKY